MIDQYPTAFRTDPQPSFDLITKTWFPGFSNHVLFDSLDDDEQEYAEQIILDFTGFILYYQNCVPADWSPSVIEHCLLNDFPRSLARTEEYEYSIFNVLLNFFAYLKEEKLLPGADDLFSHLISIEDELDEKMGDPDLYSSRKAFIIIALEEGIDLNDNDALQKFFLKEGIREMEGHEPEIVDAINQVIISWVLPFSDSRYISAIDSASGDDVILVTGLLMGSLIEGMGVKCHEWDSENVTKSIQKTLIPYPFPNDTRALCIPILHAFFTYLADENLQPQARDIADSILPLQEQMIAVRSDIGSDLEYFIARAVINSGVNLTDETAITEFLDENKDALVLEFLKTQNPEELKKLVINNITSTEFIEEEPRKQIEISSIPKANREWFTTIAEMTNQFCNERLDEDYAGLCRHVAGKLARKRDNKITRGKREIWAAGIIYAVGQMNFLFDKSFEPYQSADDICQYFGTSKSTTSQKAKLIRDLIGMDDYWDPEYSTSYMRNKNPFEKFCMTKNGFII